jgi:MoxR-like ATPase
MIVHAVAPAGNVAGPWTLGVADEDNRSMTASAPTVIGELLERDSELEQLAKLIEAAVAGEGSTVALEGEAGIGKSALLAYALRRARNAGLRVLSARSGELEHDFGYGVVRQREVLARCRGRGPRSRRGFG